MNAITKEVEAIARSVCQEMMDKASLARKAEPQVIDEQSKILQRIVSIILAKEFISIKETALLLGCSDSHIRNLVDKAKRGKAVYPIPYRDLDGVTVFRREELLEWTKARKPKSKSVRRMKEYRNPS